MKIDKASDQQKPGSSTEIIKMEQVKLLHANAYTAIAVNLIISVVFVVLMYDHVPHSLLITWLAALYIAVAVRSLTAYFGRRTPLTSENVHTWARYHTFGAAITGILWGIIGVIMMFYGDTLQHTMAAFILAGMAAGAIGTTGALASAYLLFVLPMLLPINLMFYLEGDPDHLLMGAMTTLYIAVAVVSFKRYHLLLNQSISLGFENLNILDELKQKNSQLNKSEQRMRDITSKLAEGLVVLDRDGKVTYMNPEAERLLGWPADQLIGKDLHEHIHKDASGDLTHKASCRVIRAIKEGSARRIENEVFTHQNGSHFPVSLIAAAMSGNDPKQAIVLSFQDITERKNAERKLKNSKKRFQDVAMISADWIWETDQDGKYTYTSSRVEDVLGYKPEDLLGKTPFDLMSEEEVKRSQEIVCKIISEKKPLIDLENWNLTKDGQQVCLQTNGIPMLDDDDNLIGYRGVDKDITERKEMEDKLSHMARHDELTGLLNRHILNTLLEDEVIRGERYKRIFSIFMLDIDHFKQVNDTYGHDAGDTVLKEFAKLINQSIRTTDHASRYGGEEFVIILPETTIDGAVILAERLRRDIETIKYELNDGNVIEVTASIGIASFPQHGTDRKSILIAADKALYIAKETGRNRISIAEAAS